jgi:hypothetical protein
VEALIKQANVIEARATAGDEDGQAVTSSSACMLIA